MVKEKKLKKETKEEFLKRIYVEKEKVLIFNNKKELKNPEKKPCEIISTEKAKKYYETLK